MKRIVQCVVLIGIISVISCQDKKSAMKIPGAYKALEMMSHQRAYPKADIPSEAYGEAYAKMQSALAYKSPPLSEWQAMGPWNTAGRTLSLALNPQADSTVYLGSASGGLWRSRRLGLGQTWEHIPTGHPVLGVSAIAITPGDSMHIFIGTGEVYNYQKTGTDAAYRATRGSFGIGILHSADAGKTWSKSLDWSYDQQRGVQAIQIAPSDVNMIYAATTHGIYKSTNLGNTWELVYDRIMAVDIAIHDSNPDRVIASFGNLGSPGGGMAITEDGGMTWKNINLGEASGFQGKILLDHLDELVYASVGNGFSFEDGATWLMKSENFGQTWNIVNTTDYSRWQGWFSHDVAINPFDPTETMNVGIDIWLGTDGGSSITQVSSGGVFLGRPEIETPDGPPYYSHSDHHVVKYHPNIPGCVLFGNDGGLFLSADAGRTLRSANGGLQTTQFYNGFSVSPIYDRYAMGGLQDNSTVIWRGDARWQRVIGGDGSWTAVHPTRDNIVFGSSQNLNILRSNDFGNNFTGSTSGLQGSTVFIAPYVISPANPDVMYAGTENIYRSTNSGMLWRPTRDEGENDPFFSMAASFQSEDVLYAGTAPWTNRPMLYHTTNGGQSWTNITRNLPDRYPNDIAVDPTDDRVAYVVFAGFGTGHVYKTMDAGSTWQDISANLPDIPTNAVIVDPFNTDHIYVGNDFGVFFSSNGGASWEPFHTGIEDVYLAMDLTISPNDKHIWVATHGRGAYKRPLQSNPTSTLETVTTDLKVFPNPTAGLLTIENPKIISTVQCYDANGRLLPCEMSGQTIDLSGMTDGLVIVRATDIDGNIWVSKVIKQ